MYPQFIKSAPKHENAATYKYQSAQNYYRYGHWDEARVRYEELYNIYCHSDPVGVISWQTLLNMATELDNIDEKERLALLQKEKQCKVEGVDSQKKVVLVTQGEGRVCYWLCGDDCGEQFPKLQIKAVAGPGFGPTSGILARSGTVFGASSPRNHLDLQCLSIGRDGAGAPGRALP